MLNKYVKFIAIAILVVTLTDFAWYTYTNNRVMRDYEVTTGTRVGSGIKLSGTARENRQNYFLPRIEFTDNTGKTHIVEGSPQSSKYSYEAVFSYLEPKQGDSFPIYYDAKEPDVDYLYNEGKSGLFTWHLPIFISIYLLPLAVIFAVAIELRRRQNKAK